jgi:hypothetical protein
MFISVSNETSQQRTQQAASTPKTISTLLVVVMGVARGAGKK